MTSPQTLTLILAATPSLGIGRAGTLPWPQLKKEMAYFARVTKRVSNPSKRNAVLMGRKTWDSIPARLRPLKDRLNVVVTRDAEAFAQRCRGEQGGEAPVVASGLLDALARIARLRGELERVFVIGGASVYTAALELPQTRFVLLTKMRDEFECDTYFSVDLEESEVWRRVGREEAEKFTGEEMGGLVEEKGVGFEFCLFERRE
ncbi:dihydrofolate reductase-like domain-containing protein [Ampelomyces quisqualis]|uniref:Dihydrofolate reductase n=1 Tax=Ampelomyces quisqualis TaxID=50730 RepID=A0A6A5QPM9_AMPQU|nr:dihydrofolate reductase-like domain-containing protein [Ampelomyces quisqualis]